MQSIYLFTAGFRRYRAEAAEGAISLQYHAISGTVFRFILINVDARALRGPVSREGRVVSFHTSF